MAEPADVPAGTVFGTEGPAGSRSSGDFCGPWFEGARPTGRCRLPHSLGRGPHDPACETCGTVRVETGARPPAGDAGEPAAGNPAGEQEPRLPDVADDRNNSGERGVVTSGGGLPVRSGVAFEAEANLYLRDVSKGETVQLDAPQKGCPQGTGQGEREGGTGESSR